MKGSSNMKNKYFVYDNNLLKVIKNYDLSLNEFLVLVYLINNYNNEFNVENISLNTNLSLDIVMESFDKLMRLKLVMLDTTKDLEGKILETINLSNLDREIELAKKEKETKDYETKIYDAFEREFVRTLSPIEYEIINGWLDSKYSEELILEALKEAVYNGATNLKYIDKILYEWHKKGYKTVADIENSRKNQELSNTEVFDYNWLEDDE